MSGPTPQTPAPRSAPPRPPAANVPDAESINPGESTVFFAKATGAEPRVELPTNFNARDYRGLLMCYTFLGTADNQPGGLVTLWASREHFDRDATRLFGAFNVRLAESGWVDSVARPKPKRLEALAAFCKRPANALILLAAAAAAIGHVNLIKTHVQELERPRIELAYDSTPTRNLTQGGVETEVSVDLVNHSGVVALADITSIEIDPTGTGVVIDSTAFPRLLRIEDFDSGRIAVRLTPSVPGDYKLIFKGRAQNRWGRDQELRLEVPLTIWSRSQVLPGSIETSDDRKSCVVTQTLRIGQSNTHGLSVVLKLQGVSGVTFQTAFANGPPRAQKLVPYKGSGQGDNRVEQLHWHSPQAIRAFEEFDLTVVLVSDTPPEDWDKVVHKLTIEPIPLPPTP